MLRQDRRLRWPGSDTTPMNPLSTNVFDLPDRLAAKADPALIGSDGHHLAAVAGCLAQQRADLAARLEETRTSPVRMGQEALDRDLQTHRLSARLALLQRFGVDICLGRIDRPDGSVYVGRIGLIDDAGRQLLVDWRSPAAKPFFAATLANPMGLTSRRRYRWTGERITDYWDETFTTDSGATSAALDDQSAFIASLGASRSPRMRDVLGTIAADQDAVVRAGSQGPLVVDGGPGTGKTVVALHRAAYLLYADPRLDPRRGGVLVVGPHQPYLAYVEDVLPSLGEEGVRLCTLRDLVAEGAAARPEGDPAVARLKSARRMVDAIEVAVRFYEDLPAAAMTIDCDGTPVRINPQDWAEAADAPDDGTAHNDARAEIWEALLDILVDRFDAGIPLTQRRQALQRNEELTEAMNHAWPLIDAVDLVGDLWSVPAYLRHCAPWLSPEEVLMLQRADAGEWTVADLPLIDAARHRLGDPHASRRRQALAAATAARREEMAKVVDHLIAADDSTLQVMSMLRGADLQHVLVDDALPPAADADALGGPFAHVVVDEAQELTDAEWQMVLRRCPSRSLTIVGDRAQARHGFTESWVDRLARVGLPTARLATLGVNYRTPVEVMTEAEPVIRSVLPDANVPLSIRSTGIPVRHGSRRELPAILDEWVATHDDGIACVIGDSGYAASPRVRSLSPELAKGLEFDLVVLVDPDGFGEGIEGAVDRYVAMTRSTGRLVVLT